MRRHHVFGGRGPGRRNARPIPTLSGLRPVERQKRHDQYRTRDLHAKWGQNRATIPGSKSTRVHPQSRSAVVPP